jgi:hypothetical protein
MKRAIVFVDAGFLSKLNKYFGEGDFVSVIRGESKMSNTRNKVVLKNERK